MPHQEARRLFPRGLTQPEGGFRFGADALLLASFAAPAGGRRVLDLGTGCGPAGLGLLLARGDADTTVLGLDRDPAMVAAAAANAGLLGLADRFTARYLDVRAIRAEADIRPESFDLALANPPYRDPASGRRAPSASRDAARFETEGGLAAFADAAASALGNGASLALVHLAERLGHVFACLTARKLEVKRLMPIAPRLGAPARQVLLLATKNGRPGLRLDPALALYEGSGPDTRLSAEALGFCPFLACNAGPRNAAP
ncbi:MAG: methyltransferase domain-containing protein [Solidesulfovibrio sp.]|uniref:tRNA1(Val) (adenine(37)-N6)-methyltransferase n=1 Tax=Solidesulfovibrio sp. TaxID=2910990 RepID=UPI002B1FE8D1|nr:methyltransferase domain-containing protein [Solidesulfovibrio sp.]MEA4855505.1 methyltransferase domain-containing protein [Solidesulfovibrio sp.]